jgi:glycine cleavage system H protein
MKELSELQFPADLRYTKEHEWAKVEGDRIRIGITDYAQDQLGDIVFVEAPELGATYSQGQECGTLESVKAVGELFIPVSGEIVAVNTDLEKSPDLVNRAPYTNGWLALIQPGNPSEMEGLLNSGEYIEMLKGIKE